MLILFIGDTVGRPGRAAVKNLLPEIKRQHQPDLVILNGENLSHGNGIGLKALAEMKDAGVDFFTSGNHVWGKREILPLLDDKQGNLLRPHNYPSGVPGTGAKVFTTKNKHKVLIINLQGLVFMPQSLQSPFHAATEILAAHRDQYAAIVVDFHAEATSEKIALREYLDGQVSAIVGTHTHVPTADATVTAKGTAYISDVGMVGKKDSIIGLDKDNIVHRFLTQMPVKHEISAGEAIFNAVLIDIDEKTARARTITPIYQHYSPRP